MHVQKQFVMYKNMDVQRKVFLTKDHRCIVLVNVYKNKTKSKEKEKPRRSTCYSQEV